MRRLFWKECREHLGWGILWIAATVVIAALGKGQRFIGEAFGSLWGYIPCLPALVAGLSAYGSELTGERASFALSRPLSWNQLLAAKILFGVVVAAAAATCGTVACLLTSPAQYLPFATPVHVLAGMGEAAYVPMIFYLIGLGCSIAFPGLAGAVWVFITWLVLATGGGLLQGTASHDVNPFFTYGFILASPILAAVVVARFGMTLDRNTRILRYLIVMLGVMVSGLLLTSIPGIQSATSRLLEKPAYLDVYVNPSGTAAVVESGMLLPANGCALNAQPDWVDLTNGNVVPVQHFPYPRFTMQGWIDDEHALATVDVEERKITLIGRNINGMTGADIVSLPALHPHEFCRARAVSPDRNRILLNYFSQLIMIDLRGRARTLFDINSYGFRKTATPLHLDNAFLRDCWWQSNDQVGYIDPVTNKRVIVRVQ